jgi:uncharacterized protein involved in exopolysaccharide biosynthesis
VGLQLDRQELLSKYTADSKSVRALETRIAEVQRLLDQERKTTHSTHAASGSAARRLSMELIDARTLQTSLQARLDKQKAEIDRIGSVIDRLDKLAAQRQDLDTKLQIAERAYFTYLRKEEEARFSGAVQQSKIANLAIAERAAVPRAPEPSRTLLVLLFGTLFSGGIGFIIAFLLDWRDHSVKTVSEAEVVSGLPVIGLIPADRPQDEGRGYREPPRLLPAS